MRIEYEDKDIIVVYKEAGLPVQSGRTSARDLVSMLKNHLAQEEQMPRKDSGTRDRDRASDRQPAGKLRVLYSHRRQKRHKAVYRSH